MLNYIIITNRQGKIRVEKWYVHMTKAQKDVVKNQLNTLVLQRESKSLSNIVQHNDSNIIYKRYAGLYFCFCVNLSDNPLSYLESIHFLVEVLDKYFKNVCELDLVFNFYKVDSILDELYLNGEIQETSKSLVLQRIESLDKLE